MFQLVCVLADLSGNPSVHSVSASVIITCPSVYVSITCTWGFLERKEKCCLRVSFQTPGDGQMTTKSGYTVARLNSTVQKMSPSRAQALLTF